VKFDVLISIISAIDFHMPAICSPIVRPGRPAEAEPVVSKQLSDTISRQVLIFHVALLGSIILDCARS
jgi:hypothetical protein